MALLVSTVATACSVTTDDPLGRVESELPTYRWDGAWQQIPFPPNDPWVPYGGTSSPAAIWTNGTDAHAFAFLNSSFLLHSQWNGTTWVYDPVSFFLPGMAVDPGTTPSVILNGDTFEIYFVKARDLHRVKFTKSTNTWFNPIARSELLQTGVIGVAATNMRWLIPSSGGFGRFVNRTDLFILREGGPGSRNDYLPTGNIEQWTQLGTDPWVVNLPVTGATSMPAAVSWGNGRIDLAYRADKDPLHPGVSRIVHKSWAVSRCSTSPASCWSAPDYVDVDAKAAPALAAAGTGKLLLLTTSSTGVDARLGDGITWGAPTRLASCVKANPFLDPPNVPLDPAEKVTYSAPTAAGYGGAFHASVWGTNWFVYETLYRYAEPAPAGAQPPSLACNYEGSACCSGSTCSAGFKCTTAATCTACGAVSQVCCGTTCNPGAVCGSDGKCRADCGDLGKVCCGGTTCNGGLSCSGGVCSCGGNGQACCAGSTCNPGYLCGAGGTCSPCGGIGQTCCAGNTCGGTGACAKSNTCVETKTFAAAFAIISDSNSYCSSCHGPYASGGALPFYVAGNSNATRDRLVSYSAVVPYDKDGSALYTLTKSGAMPKNITPKLDPRDVEVLGSWIKNGAGY
jgi:hypothetical protein